MSKHTIAELFQPHIFPSQTVPEFVRFALLLNESDLPMRASGEPLRYLELGPGQKERINIHAAALPEWQFYGVGDLPDNAQQAQRTAMAAGLDSLVFDMSIETLAELGVHSDLPLFDIIAIESIWSSTNEEGRQHLLSVLGRHLKIGGIVCLGYHAMPGCAPLVPLRDLMLQQTAASDDGETDPLAMLHALNFTDIYASASDSGFFSEMPSSKMFLESIKHTPFEQLQKDWLNPDWTPFYFADMAQHMDGVRCNFVASLKLASQLDMCLPEGVVPILHREEDSILRETIRDFGLNQQTRLDLFARGVSKISPETVIQRMDAMAFCLTLPLPAINALSLSAPMGELHFDDEMYTHFLQALSEDSYRPKTLAELKKHRKLETLDSALFPAVINILVAAGAVFPARTSVSAEAEKSCARLNRILCEYSRDGNVQPALASPVLGSGIGLSRIWQLFLLAYADGATDPHICSKTVLPFIHQAAGPVSAGSETLSTDVQNNDAQILASLEAEADIFFEIGLPYLAAMKAIPDTQPM